MLVIMLNEFTILRSSVTKVTPDDPWPREGVIIQLVWREDTTWSSWEDGGAGTFPTRSGKKKNKETKDSAQ